jgi:hypothetical protein
LHRDASSASSAEAYQREFLFTQDRVVSLTFPNASLPITTKFEQSALQESLKGYLVKRVEEIEGNDAFEVARDGDAFLYVLGSIASGGITIVWDETRAIDATGVIAGDPIKGDSAECSAGLDYTCRSEHSAAVSYIVDWTEACPVDLNDPFSDGKTKLLDCMTIAGFALVHP